MRGCDLPFESRLTCESRSAAVARRLWPPAERGRNARNASIATSPGTHRSRCASGLLDELLQAPLDFAQLRLQSREARILQPSADLLEGGLVAFHQPGVIWSVDLGQEIVRDHEISARIQSREAAELVCPEC